MPHNIFNKLFLALLIAIITGCGGGGSSNSTGGAVTPTNVTGKFVDATVVGIAYKCGTSTTVSGTTNAYGEFTCQTGQTVAFYVGDILLGSATASALVTPLDLAGAGATPSDTKVANIVRFLMSISSTDPATGTITITPAVVLAAAGKTVDFTATTATAIDTLIPTLKLGATVYTSAQATTHVTSSINGLFAGNYAGTYSGTTSGTWSLTIAADGTVTGTTGGLPITGAMATTLSTGSTYRFTGTAGGTPWAGTLNISTKVFSGTWNDSAGSSGTWAGTTSASGGTGNTAPTINLLTPLTGAVNTPMTITGTNLSGVTQVLFTGPSPNTSFVGGVIGTQTATSITTTVPASLAAGSYTVSVVHPGGEVAAVDTFTVPSVGMVPNAPTGVIASAFSATQINLSWPVVAGATSFNVYRSTSTGFTIGTTNKITTSPVTTRTFNDTGLSGLTQYYYKVTAINATGESVESAEVTARSRSLGLSIAPTFKSALSFADSVKITSITPALGYAQFQYRQASLDPVVAANGSEDFLDVAYVASGATATLSVVINVGTPMLNVPGATSFALTQISCDLAATTGKPTCTSLGVAFDKAVGTLTFTNTPFVYAAQATTHSVNGTLSFTPF